jgi:hypothetical protein
MQNVIKLIAVQTILGLALVLQTTPAEFTDSPFPSRHGPHLPFPTNQTPRLLNRQVKVVFFAIYKLLLMQVLTGFKSLSSKRKSSSSCCIFIGICLAFLIERIEAGSQEYLKFSQDSEYKDKGESLGGAEEYCEEVEAVVFARIYRVLGTVVKGRHLGNGAMDMELQDALRGVREELGEFSSSVFFFSWEFGANGAVVDDWEWDEEWERSRVHVNVQHSSRLVSTLLDLILRI